VFRALIFQKPRIYVYILIAPVWGINNKLRINYWKESVARSTFRSCLCFTLHDISRVARAYAGATSPSIYRTFLLFCLFIFRSISEILLQMRDVFITITGWKITTYKFSNHNLLYWKPMQCYECDISYAIIVRFYLNFFCFLIGSLKKMVPPVVSNYRKLLLVLQLRKVHINTDTFYKKNVSLPNRSQHGKIWVFIFKIFNLCKLGLTRL
jgi:hypothetical protein